MIMMTRSFVCGVWISGLSDGSCPEVPPSSLSTPVLPFSFLPKHLHTLHRLRKSISFHPTENKEIVVMLPFSPQQSLKTKRTTREPAKKNKTTLGSPEQKKERARRVRSRKVLCVCLWLLEK